ncbi:MAG TPA: superoxide dismutase family protein [Candidatus Limnocylindria bacterium]|nr:superoxide dismutase family protein [Candidatus Limnocylindria bacterium]
MLRAAGALLLTALLVAACSGSPDNAKSSATQDPSSFLAAPTNQRAMAGLLDKDGKAVGSLTLAEDRLGVRVELRVTNLPEGDHGVHIHAFARCEPPDFASAGGHYNPLGKVHGKLSTGGPHAGDLGNIAVKKDGTGFLAFTTPHLNLAPGAATNPAAGGLAVVVHAGPDDEKSDPAGNSGARIACGLIKLLPPPV